VTRRRKFCSQANSRSIFQRLAAAPAALRWGVCYVAIFAMLLLGRWQAREFIYMQF